MNAPIRPLLVAATMLTALPAGAWGGPNTGAYTPFETATRVARAQFRHVVRNDPRLMVLHTRHLTGMIADSLRDRGWLVGAITGGMPAWILSGGRGWVAAAGAVVGAGAGSYTSGIGALTQARTKTVKLGVARGLIERSQAMELERTELITSAWAVSR